MCKQKVACTLCPQRYTMHRYTQPCHVVYTRPPNVFFSLYYRIAFGHFSGWLLHLFRSLCIFSFAVASFKIVENFFLPPFFSEPLLFFSPPSSLSLFKHFSLISIENSYFLCSIAHNWIKIYAMITKTERVHYLMWAILYGFICLPLQQFSCILQLISCAKKLTSN